MRRHSCSSCRLIEAEPGTLVDGLCAGCRRFIKPTASRKVSGKIIDLTGQVFGGLTVLEMAPYTKRREKYWLCSCRCGGSIVVPGYYLRSGRTVSCGCWRSQLASDRFRALALEIRVKAGRKTLAKRRAHALRTGERIIPNPKGHIGPRKHGRWVKGIQERPTLSPEASHTSTGLTP